MIDPFYADLKRYGGRRSLIRQEHRQLLREFRHRQLQLMMLAGWFVLIHAFSAWSGDQFAAGASVVPAALLLAVGASEARRMRCTGRYMETNRTIAMQVFRAGMQA